MWHRLSVMRSVGSASNLEQQPADDQQAKCGTRFRQEAFEQTPTTRPESYPANVMGRSPRATSCGAKLEVIFEPHTISAGCPSCELRGRGDE